MNVGQINRGSNLGEYIYQMVLQDDIKTIVEIGTWNGMGSTKCVYDAIIDKNDNSVFYTIECNEHFHKQCIDNYKNLKITENFNFLLGTIINTDEYLNPLINFKDDFFKSHSRDEQYSWYVEDINNCKNVNNVLNLIPDKIDLLILDGGEFSSLSEFNKLKDRSKYFILDDTNCIKNYEVSNIMRNSDEYEIIADSNERNGYLISKKLIK